MRQLLVFTALVFTVMLLMPGTARVDPPVRFHMEAEFDWVQNQWEGTITGDISGKIVVTPSAGMEHGKAYHFAETWVIRDEQGNLLLAGNDEGVVSPNNKFTAGGRVTDAAPQWSHLIGRTLRVNGQVTWGPPTTGSGDWMIM